MVNSSTGVDDFMYTIIGSHCGWRCITDDNLQEQLKSEKQRAVHWLKVTHRRTKKGSNDDSSTLIPQEPPPTPASFHLFCFQET